MFGWIQWIDQIRRMVGVIMADVAELKVALLEVKAGVDGMKDVVVAEIGELKPLYEAQDLKISNLIAKVEELTAALEAGEPVDLSELSEIAAGLKADVATAADSISKISDAIVAVPSPEVPVEPPAPVE